MKRKRGKGEGSIYLRADGRWAGRVSTGYRRGKRVRQWLYGKTRAEVAEKLRGALTAHADGTLPAPARLTTSEFLQCWLNDTARPKLRPRTWVSYEQVIRLHILPDIGRIRLQRLMPQHVQSWLNAMASRGMSPRSCAYARAILRSALAQAVRWSLVPRNVAALVDAPRVPKHEIKPLSPDEARRLLAKAKGHRFEALLTVAIALGLREGEALGLKSDAIDLDAGLLHVRVSLQRINKEVRLVEPKTARSRRTIVMPEVVIAALRAHRVRQLEARMLAGSRWVEGGYVFTTRNGKPLEPSNMTKTFKALLKQADVRDVRFHDLRHTAATFLLAMGVDPRTIMETLGHSQISLTLNTYSHVLPSLKTDAARRMNKMLSEGIG